MQIIILIFCWIVRKSQIIFENCYYDLPINGHGFHVLSDLGHFEQTTSAGTCVQVRVFP